MSNKIVAQPPKILWIKKSKKYIPYLDWESILNIYVYELIDLPQSFDMHSIQILGKTRIKKTCQVMLQNQVIVSTMLIILKSHSIPKTSKFFM